MCSAYRAFLHSNSYIYDPARELPIGVKNPQRETPAEEKRRLERQKLKEMERAREQEEAADVSTVVTVATAGRRGRRTPSKPPRARTPVSARLQVSMLSRKKVVMDDGESAASDDNSDDDAESVPATDGQVIKSYKRIMGTDPRKDGKIPWTKIFDDLTRQNLIPGTKHSMGKIINQHIASTDKDFSKPVPIAERKHERRNVVDAPEATYNQIVELQREMQCMKSAMTSMTSNNAKLERALQESKHANDLLMKKLENGTNLVV